MLSRLFRVTSAPHVSVVTTVFNGAEYIRESLGSVLRQTGIDLELIVVDDGSTDGSPEILKEIAQADPRVRVLRQPNAGLTQALVRGCAEVRAPLIARHDSDDWSLDGRLAVQAARLNSDPQLSMCSCSCRALGPRGEYMFEITRHDDPNWATDQLVNHDQGIPHGSMMFRRSHYEQVSGYRPQFYFAQDKDLWFRLAEVGKLTYLPQVYYAYRLQESSISSRFRESQLSLAKLIRSCRAARLSAENESELLQQASQFRPDKIPTHQVDPTAGAYFIGRCLSRHGDRRARDYLWRVLQRKPWKIGAWLGLMQTVGGGRLKAKG